MNHTDQLSRIETINEPARYYPRSKGWFSAEQAPEHTGIVYAVRELLIGQTLTSPVGLMDEVTTYWSTPAAANARAEAQSAAGWAVAVEKIDRG